jgi:hypothetical protein
LEHGHEREKRIHSDRTPGGNRYYCVIDGNIDAGTATGKEAGKVSYLSVEPETMGLSFPDVHRRSQWVFHVRLGEWWF